MLIIQNRRVHQNTVVFTRNIIQRLNQIKKNDDLDTIFVLIFDLLGDVHMLRFISEREKRLRISENWNHTAMARRVSYSSSHQFFLIDVFFFCHRCV